MKGLVIINGYPNGAGFIRQGERIARELTALGAQTKVVKNGELYAVLKGNGGVECDLAKEYAFAVYLDKDKYLGRMLEACGLRLFNTANAVETCDDKLRTYYALRPSGLRLIQSVAAPLCYTPSAEPNEYFLRGVAKQLGFPMVAKKSYGSFGAGVQLVPGYAELLAVEREWLHVPHFYQSYVEESFGRDIRVIVIGGKAVAAMERQAQAGEFRSNIELGGTGNKILLPAAYKEAAEIAAKTLGLDYCGVDLLEGRDCPIVCEVNSNAFFEGIERVTGQNIAKAYAEHIVRCMQ